MIAEAKRATDAGADFLELRLDYLDCPDADAASLLAGIPGAKIVTCRPPDEGGRYAGDERVRISLLEAAAGGGAEMIDCEFAACSRSDDVRAKLKRATAVDRESDAGGCKLVLSHHDFARTPEDLGRVLESLRSGGAQVAKVATKAETITDSLRMLSALREMAGRMPTIALCMGEAGLMTRVLARKLGAFLTFASLEQGRESAPGQPTIAELRDLYRWDAIDADTVVYGVIGCPVAHSMSPAIHNAAFGEVGVNAVYLPFLVEPGTEPFDAFVGGCIQRPWLTLRGLSVTIPHKRSALAFAGENVEPLAVKIGAVNTLVIDESGAVRGLNTDYAAILDSLTSTLNCARTDLAAVPVAVLGGGGAARAAVAGLSDCGCAVTIFNRTGEKARGLAAEFACEARPWGDRSDHGAKIVINTTSLGMHPHTDATPLPAEALREDMTVFDTVYNPIETQLLAAAGQAGCIVIDGVTMFVRQAAAQFKLFTGHDAPVALMRDVVTRRLTG